MVRKTFMRAGAVAAAGFVALAVGAAADAQTMSTNSASFNAGYGRTSGQENQPVNVDLTDANGNLVVINGLFQANSSSMFAGASARLSGAADSFSGAGSVGGSASAIGNNLNVVVEGSDNTVIVQSQQTNTGNVSASTTTNGKP
ncbi:MAG: holdfast anchoring protein HfaA [Caulobacteraceae bacterium]|nr:holdfast anchoring protein HfaA [Caulobacteraceae bacterium]